MEAAAAETEVVEAEEAVEAVVAEEMEAEEAVALAQAKRQSSASTPGIDERNGLHRLSRAFSTRSCRSAKK